MSERWVLVDGYSVVHAWPRLQKLAGRKLEARREALVQVLRQYADQTGHRVTVVFDGYAAKWKPEVNEPAAGVEVLYSEQGKTADDTIERLVAQAEQRGRILVVTSDNMERSTVESLGAQSVAAEVFELEVKTALDALADDVRQHSRRRGWGAVREHWK